MSARSIEGIADEPSGPEVERVKEAYYAIIRMASRLLAWADCHHVDRQSFSTWQH